MWSSGSARGTDDYGGHRRRRLRAIAVLACSLSALVLVPGAATAASSINVAPEFPARVSVGEVGVAAAIVVTNTNTGADGASTVCNAGDGGPCTGAPGITLVPSCAATDFTAACTLAGADPNVFAVSPTAVGGAGSACAGLPFTVQTVDATMGTVRFSPGGGSHITLGSPGDSCRIEFTLDVLKVPADARPATGLQTLKSAEAAAFSDLNTVAFHRASGSEVTVRLAPPRLIATTPASPANDNSPEVMGTAPAGAILVGLYPEPTCAGSAVAQGSPGGFASPGFTVSVANDSTTTFYAAAVDAAGGMSSCSSGTITYVEDSSAPPAPALIGTDPPSPANSNAPRITGTAEAGSTVKLYTNATCTGALAGQATAAALHSPGIAVTVADGSTTTYSATATDAAGNTSPCSQSATTYVEDSTAPETTIDSGPTGDPAAPVFSFSSPDAGARFECRIDPAAFAPCASPYKVPALPNGTYRLQVRAVDAAGNADASSAERSFTISGSTVGASAGAASPQVAGPASTASSREQPGCTGLTGRVFVGTSRRNVRNGVRRSDIMFGLGGDDVLFGSAGNDCLYGGVGMDRLRGGSGADRLFGDGGDDRLEGGPGNDRLTGGAGRDQLIDRGGRDKLSGGSGDDRLDALDSSPRDRLAIDRIICGPGRDTVFADRLDSIARDCENVIRSH